MTEAAPLDPPEGYVMIPSDRFRELVAELINDGDLHRAHQLMDITEGDWRPSRT